MAGDHLRTIAQRVARLNPAIAIQFVELKTQIRERLIGERMIAWLAGAFGVLAMALVTVGLYGIIAYLAVSRRTRSAFAWRSARRARRSWGSCFATTCC